MRSMQGMAQYSVEITHLPPMWPTQTRSHTCRLSLLLVVVLAPRGCSLVTLVSPSPHKLYIVHYTVHLLKHIYFELLFMELNVITK